MKEQHNPFIELLSVTDYQKQEPEATRTEILFRDNLCKHKFYKNRYVENFFLIYPSFCY